MIAPKWLNTAVPIAIPDVLELLSRSLFNSLTNQSFDIGGPDILTYRKCCSVMPKQNLKDGFDCSSDDS
jgi:hypothetical protein